MFEALKGLGGTGWLTAVTRGSGLGDQATDVVTEEVEATPEAGPGAVSDDLDLGRTVQDRLSRFLGTNGSDLRGKNIRAEFEDVTGRGNFGVRGRKG
jgi:hypothetical protein